MTIPIIDLKDYFIDKANFLRELGGAFTDVGFVVVKNHGIGIKTIQDLYTGVRTLFALPLEKKKEYEVASMAGQRGYTRQGRERAKGTAVADLKEFFQFGRNDNIVPSEVADLNAVLDTAYFEFKATGMVLLEAIAEYMCLPRDHFCDMVSNGDSILRCIHYPPIVEDGGASDAVRATAHEDINLITLLVGASAEGLQVQTREGEWLAVNPEEGTIVVNIGDMMQSLTDGRLKSTTHRVINPASRELRSTSRYSVPFFVHPRGEVCVAEGGVTAREFLDNRLREIGLKMN